MISADNLHEKTEQEVFDYLVSHIEQQGPCVAETNIPRMQHNGKYCPGGLLLKDAKTYKYTEEMEDDSWEILADRGDVPGAHSALVEAIQWAHDISTAKLDGTEAGLAAFHAKFKERAKALAKIRDLKY